jgi:hypothetical protein
VVYCIPCSCSIEIRPFGVHLESSVAPFDLLSLLDVMRVNKRLLLLQRISRWRARNSRYHFGHPPDEDYLTENILANGAPAISCRLFYLRSGTI